MARGQKSKKVIVDKLLDVFKGSFLYNDGKEVRIPIEEDGEIVLVDYKTDFIKPGNEEVLIHRYKKQMDYYAMALTKLIEKNVKERIIYSVSLNKQIKI